MAPTWDEVDLAKSENRHEIVLTGADIAGRIDSDGFDERLFSLNLLNFLEISKTNLTILSPKLCNLTNLTNLVLHGNKLETVPEAIGKLTKVKFLDLSRNQITVLPPSFANLSSLHTLNASGNALTDVPEISKLTQLHILDLSHNRLETLPAGITSPSLGLLAQILVQSNKLKELPKDMSELPSLKILDVTDNQLTVAPPELSECQKLKEFRFGGNKFADRRFGKMSGDCSNKAVLDYLHGVLEKERKAAGGGKSKDKKRKKKGKPADDDDMDEITKNLMKVLHFEEAKNLVINVSENVLNVRQYIVCCVVRHLNFNRTKNMFKKFLTLQLTPLGKPKETTADKLVAQLLKEADDYRRMKRRTTLSGIHQYLGLLEGQEQYPCLVDTNGTIISFPPITNCDITKVSKDTHDLLVEVTSPVSLDSCKLVMDELLRGLLEAGLGCASEESVPGDAAAAAAAADDLPQVCTSDQVLVLEQVKVCDHNGALKVVYPSRADLNQSAAYRVDRD